jgi:hypothetical protein
MWPCVDTPRAEPLGTGPARGQTSVAEPTGMRS